MYAKVVKHAFWLIVIVFAATALCGGYVSGRAAVPEFAPVRHAPSAAPPDLREELPQTDERANDQFANDAAVAEDAAGGGASADAILSIVLVDAGHSMALESPFLSLGVPVTVVVDPRGPAARRMLDSAVQAGDRAYLQAPVPLVPQSIAALHDAYPQAAGIAARITSGSQVSPESCAALHRLGLALFDEYGEQPRFANRCARVRFSARTLTVDDHAQRAYVSYMLRQAIHLARGGTAVVMARPFPGTLQAFEDILTRTSRDGVRFAGLR